MFPINGDNSGFTYDNLSEIRLEPFWTSLASIVTAALLVVVALAASGQPPVQADAPSDDMAFVASVETDGTDGVVAAP
jgi:hypothetical protein